MTTRIGAVNSRLLLGVVGCVGAGALAMIAFPMCASEPAPRCQADSLVTVAAYSPISPPTGTGCENWVPPSLQQGTTGAGCGTNGCQAATPGMIIGELFGAESYFPDPNDPNQANEPASMALQLGYGEQRIQDYLNNYLPSLDGGVGPDGQAPLPNYPYTTSTTPAPPPQGTSSDHPYAWGQFDTVRPVNGICTVSHMIGSNVVYPDVLERE